MSIDPVTGKIVQNRVNNKINYQTSFTDFKIFHLYCKTFRVNGAIRSNEVNSILGKARKAINTWNSDHDSHAKVTLLQYCLIEENAAGMYVLSALGSRFLDLFDENGELAASKAAVNEVLFDMMAAWHQKNETFDIHPGLLLLKLLLQPELHYYITDQDVACIFNNTNNTNDAQYTDFIKQILAFRDSGVVFSRSELKKTYTLLTGYANNWEVFELEPRSNARVKYVRLTPEFRQLVEQRLGVLTESRILNDCEFTKLLEDTNEIEEKITSFEESYGELGQAVALRKARASEIQRMYRNRLIDAFGQKCLLCQIRNKELLVASHIKAYAACDSIKEKIDSNNGFLLCANHDKLFDRFLITFDSRTGKIKISPKLTVEERAACLLDENYTLPGEMLTMARRRYLIWHNNEFEKKVRQ